MKSGESQKAGPITDFLVKDHGRLEGLLQAAVAQVGSVDQGAYDQFRAGLLRHIGWRKRFSCPPLSGCEAGSHFPLQPSSGWTMEPSRHCSCRLPRLRSLQRSVPFSMSTIQSKKARGACIKPAMSWQAQKRRTFWPNFRLHRSWLCCPAPIAPPRDAGCPASTGASWL